MSEMHRFRLVLMMILLLMNPVHSHAFYQESIDEEFNWSKDWWHLLVIVLLILTGGLMAGLTIGLMSLDETHLTILQRGGTAQQQKYAARIAPLRQRGHLLLCTLLLVNTAVNEALPIFLDGMLGAGWLAILCSTASIVIFGEILPQAICSRHGLAVGGQLSWFVQGLMVLVWPIAFPIAKLLDWILGESHGLVYQRGELKELVTLLGAARHGHLSEYEVTMIKGVLDLKDKFCGDIMTPIEDVFMLNLNTKLTNRCLAEIVERGHSRVPVFTEHRTQIIGMLLVKRLIGIEPGLFISQMPLSPLPVVSTHKPLFDVLNDFQKGASHMAVVVEPATSIAVGILTLEDIIEELIQEEIIDETDQYVDVHARISVQGRRSLLAPSTLLAQRLLNPSPTSSLRRQQQTIVQKNTKPLTRSELDLSRKSPLRRADETVPLLNQSESLE